MLTTSDFPNFLLEVHQRGPFPWQQALVDGIVEKGRWPERIDVPTGLGKTSVLDVAAFLAAVRPDLARRRVFFVVDRRIVVDEAHRHAVRLRDALDTAEPGSVAHAVAEALRQSEDDVTLDVTRMRGGVTWDARWLERPDRHAIVTGTVDQVGSRLLFRGYGVTEYARSIDAALVGTDSLIVVDEAHIATPFVATVKALADLESPGEVPALRRLPTVVTMSATGKATGADPEVWTHRHTAADEAHEVAGPRLRAGKRLHLVEVRATKNNVDEVVPDALASLARSLAPRGVVGVVVNTVARARAVFERLSPGLEAVLLTGRSRPVDRDYLLARVLPRIEMGRQLAAEPFVVVATQTVEVGANLDFDALVTESAPFASLVQRLGRLNRSGEPGVVASALVVQDSTVQTDDPVYGAARSATWQWLAEQTDPVRYTSKLDPASLNGGLPASPLALRHLAESAPDGLAPEDPHIPILDESTLDAWVRTSPAPVPDPPVASFLHGLVEQRPVVSLVWRANLGEDPNRWAELADAVPPAAEEMLEVPLPAARRWLESARPDARLSDQESESDGEQPVEPETTVFRVRDGSGRPLVLAYRGRGGDAVAVPPSRIRPGDVVVVPVEYGGCDENGWHPASAQDVVDVADLAWRRRRPVLRLGPYLRTVVDRYHPELVDSPQLADLLKAVSEDGAEAVVRPDAYRDLLRELGESSRDRDLPLPRNLLWLAAASERPGSLRTTLTSDGNGGPGPWPVRLSMAGSQLADDHSEAGSATNGRSRTPLTAHQRAVATWARQFAENLGLHGLVEAVGIAARHHDEGKRDPRMQAMLWGGSRLRADAAAEPIAKSGMDPADRQAYRRARERAGYPTGMRHEALSARIVAAYLAGMSEVDQDLVVHLVASHHGRSRPLLPPIVDEAPETVTVAGIGEFSTAETVDWDAPRRFARLNQRYGRWGLALLETVVRLADIWCSARDESVKEDRR